MNVTHYRVQLAPAHYQKGYVMESAFVQITVIFQVISDRGEVRGIGQPGPVITGPTRFEDLHIVRSEFMF